MPAHAPNPLREARVGLVTLCLVLGTTALMVVVSSVHWQPRETYQLAFKVSQDATGIEPGTPVSMGGIHWGEVTRVTPGEIPARGSLAPLAEPGAMSKSRGTLVEFAIDSRLELWPDAKVARTASILGGDVQLVILDTGLTRGSVGSLATKGRDALGNRDVLQAWDGNTAVPNLFGTRLASKLEQLPEDWAAIKAYYADHVEDSLPARRESIRASFVAVRDAVRADVGRWQPMLETMASTFREFRGGMSGPDGLLDTVQSGWKGMRTDADVVQTNFAALRDRVNDQLEPRMLALADRATGEWRRTQEIWRQLAESGVESWAAYGSFMADSSLMGGQLDHAADDGLALIFGLLLGKPGEDGMARLQRFEAASRLAVAVSDLRCANEALLAMADGSEPVDPAMARRLRDAASRCVARFRSAVDRLNQLWQQPAR